MPSLFRRITEWGVRPDTSREEINRIRLTNIFLLLMLVGSILETAAYFASGATIAGLINSSAPLVFGGGLLAMRAGHVLLARVLVMTVAYLATYLLATICGPEAQLQLLLLFGSGVWITFFSLRYRAILASGLIFPIVLFALLEITSYAPILGMHRAQLTPANLLFIRLASVAIIWGLMIGHFLFFVRNRSKAEERLVSSAKMVAVGRMAAGIAHEINNPLQRIVGHAERLKSIAASGNATVEQIHLLSEQIQSVAMRIASIVRGLLTLSRDASTDPFLEVFAHSLVSLSLDYSRARLESHKIEVKMGEIPKHWTIIGREAQLSEVLLNLISNAHDAVLDAPEKWIHIGAVADANAIEISVTDSGRGIDPGVAHRIFDPFFTTKQLGQGTGLGLSVSQGIMEAHRGEIVFDRKSSHTRFVIRIPRGPDR